MRGEAESLDKTLGFSQHMNHMNLSPAEYVIRLFGGVRATSRAIGRSPGSISKWQKAGHIPSSVQHVILRVAREMKLDVTAEDLINGRKVSSKSE